MARFAALALLALALPGLLPPRTQGAEPDTHVRLYYSNWMQGEVERSPADPDGRLAGGAELHQNPVWALEVIFWRRLGLNFTRQKLQREFPGSVGVTPGCAAAGCLVRERTLEQSLNLTLYAAPVAHEQFNAFLGGGSGFLDYEYSVNGVRQTTAELHDGLSLVRWFAGVDLVYDRIGFRLEIGSRRAEKTVPPDTVAVDSLYQHLTLVIPLN